MTPVTPKPVLYIVVGTLSAIAIMGLGIMGYVAINAIKAAPEITTAIITLTSSALAGLAAILVSTKQGSGPIETTVVNETSDPVPTKATK